MAGFEPQIFGVGSNHSTNCATTIFQLTRVNLPIFLENKICLDYTCSTEAIINFPKIYLGHSFEGMGGAKTH